MKKITFILFTLIAGTAFAQNSDNATAVVKANIVTPIGITLEPGTMLDFGTFTRPAAGTETVTINAAGDDREFSSTDMFIGAYTTFSAPQFNITRDSNSKYNIKLETTVDPKNAATTPQSMSLTDLKHSITTTGNTAEKGLEAASFTVGGKLSVPFDIPVGVYTGEIKVTVAYD